MYGKIFEVDNKKGREGNRGSYTFSDGTVVCGQSDYIEAFDGDEAFEWKKGSCDFYRFM